MSLLPAKEVCLVLLSLVFLYNCNTKLGDEGVSGNIQPKDEVLSTFFRNDFVLKTTTMLYDTVLSNYSPRRLIVGRYEDPIFGVVEVNTFTQFDLSNKYYSSFGPNTKLDSILLYVTFTSTGFNYSYGQKGATQKIYIHRLSKSIDRTVSYTTKSSLDYNPVPLGILEFTNSVYDSLKLDNSLGQAFIDSVDRFANIESFQSFFKGLAIINDPTNTSVWGIGNLRIKLFYHNYYALNNLKVNGFADILMSKEIIYSSFNQIKHTRSSGQLASLQNSYDSLTATQTQNTCYLQSYGEVGTVVKFPFIDTLIKSVDGKILVDRADLVIKPVTDVSYPPPPYLLVYELNSDGKIRRPNGITAYLQNEIFGIFGNGSRLFIPYNIQKQEYRITLTTYMQALIDKNLRKPNYGLFIIGTDDVLTTSNNQYLFYSNVNRAIFYNDLSKANNIKLDLYYSPYK